MGTPNVKPAVSAKPAAEQVNNTEETISGYLRDCKKHIAKVNKGIESFAELGNDAAIQTAKQALEQKKLNIAQSAAKKVYVYLTGVEPKV